MLNGYRIVDADCHVLEPTTMWREFLDPSLRDRGPQVIDAENGLPADGPEYSGGPTYLALGNTKVKNNLQPGLRAQWLEAWVRDYSEYYAMGFNSESQVMALKHLGVDHAYLYPTDGVFLLGMADVDPVMSAGLATAYNRWLHQFCSRDTDLLRGVGAISRHDPDAMITELHRVAAYGWTSVAMVPNPVGGRRLGDPAYEKFWTECERLNMGVAIHEVTHLQSPTVGSDRFETRFGMHACSHPMEQMIAFVALLEAGVLERHPALRVAFLEAGCGWVPYWLNRLDGMADNLRWEVGRNVRLKPSEYFRRQCFVSVEPSEVYLGDMLKFIGEENILFGSDYPHADHKPDILHELVGLERCVHPATLQRILWDNPRRFYGIDR